MACFQRHSHLMDVFGSFGHGSLSEVDLSKEGVHSVIKQIAVSSLTRNGNIPLSLLEKFIASLGERRHEE